MYKSTREFIKARQPHARFDLQVVNVKRVGGGKINDCSSNAIENVDNMDGVASVMGWLIEPFNPLTNSTSIIQHWWNRYVDGGHFDTTPDPLRIDCEYVMDLDLRLYVKENFDQLESIVGCSLIYKDGAYTAALADLSNIQNVRYKPIDSLDTKTLFTIFN